MSFTELHFPPGRRVAGSPGGNHEGERHDDHDKVGSVRQDGVSGDLSAQAAEPRAKRIQVQPGKVKPAVTGAAAKNGG